MPEKYFDRTKEADRHAFGVLLAPLIVASRTKDFADPAKAKTQLHVWMLSLGDVPPAILTEAVERLIAEGITWMPRPGDVKVVCCNIVDERRAAAARQAKALQEDCPDCHGTGWADVEGPSAVVRCNCLKRALELIRAAGEAIPRPALPPSSDESEVA